MINDLESKIDFVKTGESVRAQYECGKRITENTRYLFRRSSIVVEHESANEGFILRQDCRNGRRTKERVTISVDVYSTFMDGEHMPMSEETTNIIGIYEDGRPIHQLEDGIYKKLIKSSLPAYIKKAMGLNI